MNCVNCLNNELSQIPFIRGPLTSPVPLPSGRWLRWSLRWLLLPVFLLACGHVIFLQYLCQTPRHAADAKLTRESSTTWSKTHGQASWGFLGNFTTNSNSAEITTGLKYTGRSEKVWNDFSNTTYLIETLSAQTKAKIEENVFNKTESLCTGSAHSNLTRLPNSLASWTRPVIDDIMLVIVLNYESVFKVVPLLEFIHRPVFSHITYCGPNLKHFVAFAVDLGLNYVTYVEGLEPSTKWHNLYMCVARAMELNTGVKGYLHIGDDVMLNTWNVWSLDRDRMWIPGGFTKQDIQKPGHLIHDYHWLKPWGREALLRVFQELRNLSSQADSDHTKNKSENSTMRTDLPKNAMMAHDFLNNYDRNLGQRFVLKRAIDLFYIPKKLKDKYIFATQMFKQYNCYVELAIPAIHLGLVQKSDVIYVEGASLWRNDRNNPWSHWKPHGQLFVHPFKLEGHLKQKDGRSFFCDSYMKKLTNFIHDKKRS